MAHKQAAGGQEGGGSPVSARVKRALEAVEQNEHIARLVSDARDASVHRLTTLMIVASAFVLFGVPHVRALLVPPTTLHQAGIYAISMVFAVPLYLVTWFATLPTEVIDAADGPALGRSGGWYVGLHRRFQWAGRWIDGLITHVKHRPVTALVLMVLALSLLLVFPAPFVVNLVALAGWLLVRAVGTPWPLGTESSRAAASQLIGRTVTMLLVANLVVEAVWKLQMLLGRYHGTYSIWALFQTLFVITVVVRMVDVLGLLGVLGSAQWRFAWALALVAGFTVFPSGARVGEVRSGAEASGGAASLLSPTGTARAATSLPPPWVDQLGQRLEELPQGQPAILVAASGGGSRAAITASLVYELLDRTPGPALGDRPSRMLADNVLLASSVSGGSLATAYFYTHRPSGYAGEPGGSPFVQAMGRDYMAPLLRGVLNITQERGDAVASFWRRLYGWENVYDDDARAVGRPLIVLNGTHVQEGTRVAFGFPGLPAGLIEPRRVAADIGPGHRLNLADAVRISANFPYGFDHVRYGNGSHELIDGGVVDNTGIDTLVAILEALQGRAASDGGEGGPADRVFSELQQRGVVVVEIDAGARPAKPSFLARQFPTLSKPLEALGRSGHLKSSTLRERNLDRFEELLAPGHVGLVRAGPACDPDGDVMTAWALHSEDRERIVEDFGDVEPLIVQQLTLDVEAIARLQRAKAALDPEAPVDRGTRRLEGLHREYEELARVRASAHHLCVERVGAEADVGVQEAGERLQAGLSKAATVALAEGVPESPDSDGPEPAPAEAVDEAEPAPEVEPTPARATRREAEPKRHDKTVAKREVVAAGDRLRAQKPGPVLSRKSVRQLDPLFAKKLTKSLSTRPRTLGWVYLGTLDGTRWETRYASWKHRAVPRVGEHIRLVGSSRVRTSMPNDGGALASSRMTLPPGTELVVLETGDWGDAGFIWARVAAR